MISEERIREKVEEYLFNNFPYDPRHTVVSRIDKPADLPRQWVKDTGPMFWVRDDTGELLSVVKIIQVSDHDPWKFANLEKSIEIFNQLNLKFSQTISILGSKRTLIEDTALDICVMNPAPGRGLHEFFLDASNTGTQTSQREKALEKLHLAVRGWADALAELHLSRAIKIQSFPKTEKDRDAEILHRVNSLMEASPNLFPFQKNVFSEMTKLLANRAEKNDIYVGVTHGDADPTNVIYEDTSGQWTVVDIDNLTWSIDSEGKPTSRLGLEFIHAKLSLIKAGFFQNFSEEELKEVGSQFQNQYKKSAGNCLPTPEQNKYYSALYFCKKITWISGLEEGLKYTTNHVPDYFEAPGKYRESLIQSLKNFIDHKVV